MNIIFNRLGRKGKVLKSIAVVLSGAFFLSAMILSFYKLSEYKERGAERFKLEERRIAERCGRSKEKFALCSYPQADINSYIKWNKADDNSEDLCLNIVFMNNSVKYSHGIHFHLTLLLRPYLKKGILEFLIKHDNDFSLEGNLEIYLKAGPRKKAMVVSSLPIRITPEWQKVSMPLKNFAMVNKTKGSENKSFPWEIQEVIFSVNSFNLNKPLKVSISNLKVVVDSKVIYEVL